MSRYRKIEVRIWSDARFMALSSPQPCGQFLWFYLLTGPFPGYVPGLFRASREGMAADLGWPVNDFDQCFTELESAGMAVADWDAKLVFLPNAFKYNRPESPNVVASWGQYLDELPECDLLLDARKSIDDQLIDLGDQWIGAFDLGKIKCHRPQIVNRSVSKSVKERDGIKCRYCGKEVNWNDRKSKNGGTLDHVDPAGPSTPENLVVACRACNSKKGFRTPKMAKMELLSPPAKSNGSTTDKSIDNQMTINGFSINQEQEQEQKQEQEQEQNKNKKNTKKKLATAKEILQSFGIDGLLAEDFIKHRATKKAAITETALLGFQREAEKAGIDLREAIRISIEKGWVGFNAKWEWGEKASNLTANEKTREGQYIPSAYEEMLAQNALDPFSIDGTFLTISGG